jgi:hypothetical protein
MRWALCFPALKRRRGASGSSDFLAWRVSVGGRARIEVG